MKSLRESAREFNHAWADLLRVLAEMLNEAAARFDGRAFADEAREIRDEKAIAAALGVIDERDHPEHGGYSYRGDCDLCLAEPDTGPHDEPLAV